MMTTETFAKEIEDCAEEPIIGIVLSASRDGHWYEFSGEPKPDYAEKVLSWAIAKPILEYTYHAGFGGQDCHSIYAWTENWVLLVSGYDGATDVRRIPRNPVPCTPESI